MKFLIDMPVTPEAVAFLTSRGHDAVHAYSAGLATATDSQILAVARRDGRIVITADLDYRAPPGCASDCRSRPHPPSWRFLF